MDGQHRLGQKLLACVVKDLFLQFRNGAKAQFKQCLCISVVPFHRVAFQLFKIAARLRQCGAIGSQAAPYSRLDNVLPDVRVPLPAAVTQHIQVVARHGKLRQGDRNGKFRQPETERHITQSKRDLSELTRKAQLCGESERKRHAGISGHGRIRYLSNRQCQLPQLKRHVNIEIDLGTLSTRGARQAAAYANQHIEQVHFQAGISKGTIDRAIATGRGDTQTQVGRTAQIIKVGDRKQAFQLGRHDLRHETTEISRQNRP